MEPTNFESSIAQPEFHFKSEAIQDKDALIIDVRNKERFKEIISQAVLILLQKPKMISWKHG